MIPSRSLLERASNFRDLGGYRTTDGRIIRHGMVYRSGALHDLSEADLQLLRSMGILVAFDLRSEAEQEAEPLAASFVRHVSVSLTRAAARRDLSTFKDGEAYLRARYEEILFEFAGSGVGFILTAIARSDCLPAVIHCAAGKDRTGVIAAVLLLAVGVDEATVLDDYALTSEYEALHRVQELTVKLSGGGLPPALVAGLLGTHPAALAAALDALRNRFGTIENYLTDAAGLSRDDLSLLRSRLTS